MGVNNERRLPLAARICRREDFLLSRAFVRFFDFSQRRFDPHDDSDYVEIAYNTVYGNGNHGIIASKRCNDISIHDNEVYDGGAEAVGIFLHRSSDNAAVYSE